MKRSASAALIVLLCTTYGVASAQGETLLGRVVGVADGDTITVLSAENRQIKVRLAEIDAPEKAQPFGAKSKRSLSDLCFGKTAELKPLTVDRYGRTVARVFCAGVDANAEQVRRGLAWVYDRYVTDHSLYELQEAARAQRLGLWSESGPVPPWDWRRRKSNTGT